MAALGSCALVVGCFLFSTGFADRCLFAVRSSVSEGEACLALPNEDAVLGVARLVIYVNAVVHLVNQDSVH